MANSWFGYGVCAAVLGAISASSPAQSQPSAGEPIMIGAVVSATGGGAGAGTAERNGILLGQKLINQRGGINGRPLKILIEDDGSNPDAAVTKMNDLVFNKRVRAILGTTMVANTVATGAITAKQGIPQLSYSGLGPAVERSRNCLFHLLPAQELNARALLEYATRAVKAKRIGVLHDSGYGNVVMAALKSVAKEYGVEFAQVEKFEISATDVTTQAAKVKASSPEAVLVIASSATPFRSAKQVKISAPIIGAIASSAYEYVKAMGDAADGIVFAEFLIAEDPLPYQKEFVEEYKKEFGVNPKNYEAAAYDSVLILANALKKSGSDASGDKICESLRTTHQGVIASYNFSAPDLTGLSLSSYNYSKLVGGKFTRLPFKAGQ